MTDIYSLLVFLHILGFVYWLGGDLGVYYFAGDVADPDRPKPERLRILKTLMKVDLYPRIMLIAMIPLGFQIGAMSGRIEAGTPVLVALWLASAAWMALMLHLHHHPTAMRLKQLDLFIRYAILAVLAVTGIMGVARFGPVLEPWLAAKLVLYAGVIGLGLLLRGCVAQWIRGFALLETADEAQGNRLITAGRKQARRYALTLWAGLILMGALGTLKPLF